MRMLLGETADVVYPNKYMMRTSDGNWTNKTVMRVLPLTNISALEAVGTTILGKTSGATAIIASATSFSEGGAGIVEFELNSDSVSSEFTFIEGETLSTTSTVQDITMTFTLKNIVASGVVTNRSALYTENQLIDFDANTSIGNGLATARIQNIIPGSVSDVVIDDAGTKYEVGDTLTFTTSDSNAASAEGFVSIIDGSLVLEGTDTKSTDAGDFIISEDGTKTHIELFSIELERATTGIVGESLILNGTDASSTDAGHNIDMEWSINQESKDTYTTDADRFAIEEATDYSGAISRIFVKNWWSWLYNYSYRYCIININNDWYKCSLACSNR